MPGEPDTWWKPLRLKIRNISGWSMSGRVAEYGDRLPPVHVGRTGDPLIPSLFDHYAITKVRGELAVMQSRIKHRVSLRQTFIMIPDLFSLMDPIMFHQPINSFMENYHRQGFGQAAGKLPGDTG